MSCSVGRFCLPDFLTSLALTSPYTMVLTPPLRCHTWGRTKPQHLNTCAIFYAEIKRTAKSAIMFWLVIIATLMHSCGYDENENWNMNRKDICNWALDVLKSLKSIQIIISDKETEGLLLPNHCKEYSFSQTSWQSDVICCILTRYREWSKIMNWSTDTELCTYMHYLQLLLPPIRTGSHPYWITWPFRKAKPAS